jgi:hypothetical protein
MPDETASTPQNLIQHFEKSPDYRTIYATGMYGGPTVNGLLCVNFIIDIPPFPKTTESKQEVDRLIQTKADFDGKMAIREVQCGVVINLPTAKLLVEWLNNHIKILENAQPKNAK